MFSLKSILNKLTTQLIDWQQTQLSAPVITTNTAQTRTLTESITNFKWIVFEAFTSSNGAIVTMDSEYLQALTSTFRQVFRITTSNNYLEVVYVDDTTLTVKFTSSASNTYLRIYGYGRKL